MARAATVLIQPKYFTAVDNERHHSTSGRILALDFGRVHTGAAVSDPTGTIVRPLKPVENAATPEGLEAIARISREEKIARVIVGMPVSLSGERGRQALETEEFIAALAEVLPVPVSYWDERFTSKLAAAKGRHSDSDSHSLAACCLLEDYLVSNEFLRWLDAADADE